MKRHLIPGLISIFDFRFFGFVCQAGFDFRFPFFGFISNFDTGYFEFYCSSDKKKPHFNSEVRLEIIMMI